LLPEAADLLFIIVHCLRAVFPEFIAFLAFVGHECALPHAELALLEEGRQWLTIGQLLLQNIFERNRIVAEDLEMIRDQVARLAVRTCYESGAVMIALFGDTVRRPMAAWVAAKCKLVGRSQIFWRWGLLARRR
jgi:hypothetical protein